jgi:hypothetical protein
MISTMGEKVRRFAVRFELLHEETRFLADLSDTLGHLDDGNYFYDGMKTPPHDKDQRFIEVLFAPWPNPIPKNEDKDYAELLDAAGATELK